VPQRHLLEVCKERVKLIFFNTVTLLSKFESSEATGGTIARPASHTKSLTQPADSTAKGRTRTMILQFDSIEIINVTLPTTTPRHDGLACPTISYRTESKSSDLLYIRHFVGEFIAMAYCFEHNLRSFDLWITSFCSKELEIGIRKSYELKHQGKRRLGTDSKEKQQSKTIKKFSLVSSSIDCGVHTTPSLHIHWNFSNQCGKPIISSSCNRIFELLTVPIPLS
jgi:hypothetical protein